MAAIRPFRGLRFNPSKVGDLGSVMSPPFDVISPEERRQLCRRSEYNVVRLELPEGSGDGHPGGDPYAGAAQTLERWRREAILVQEGRPALYLTRHEFTYLGKGMARTELTVALRLEGLHEGSVKPHEDTRAQAKEDRLNLMLAARANISPIMLLVDGLSLERAPHDWAPLEAELGGGEHFLTWPIKEREEIGRVQEELASSPVYIADGHHRYETALTYRDRLRSGGDEAANFVMASLISFSDPGLLMLPYHRLLRGPDAGAMAKVRHCLEAICAEERQPMSGASAEGIGRAALESLARGEALFAVWGLAPGCLSLLSLRSAATVDDIAGRGHSRAWAGLATAIFREAVLLPALGLDEEGAEVGGVLAFAKDAAEAVERVNAGEYQMAILPAAVPFDTLKEVSDRGERLPPKSTHFYPKLPTGLVLRSLEGKL